MRERLVSGANWLEIDRFQHPSARGGSYGERRSWNCLLHFGGTIRPSELPVEDMRGAFHIHDPVIARIVDRAGRRSPLHDLDVQADQQSASQA